MIRWPFGKPSSGKPAAGQRGGGRGSRAGLVRKPETKTPSFQGKRRLSWVIWVPR